MTKRNSTKIEYLRLFFNETLKKCEGYNDDRALFVNMYNNLTDAVNEFETLQIVNPIIKLGFSEIFGKKLKELERLEESFKVRNMI